jgi:hypothetical protein
MDQPPYTSADFLEEARKQLAEAAVAAASAANLSWTQLGPLLDSARSMCRDDLRLGGGLALHGLEYADGELAPAQEAYLSVTARDRDTHFEWLSQTYWLSDLALADRDPERVRSAVAAMERSLAKLKAWLEEHEAAAAASEAPPADPAP